MSNRLMDGLASAHKILCTHNARGLLFGGALFRIYRRAKPRTPKDIDVLILSYDCAHHPRQNEGCLPSEGEPLKPGWLDRLEIDWWVAHGSEEKPHNDNVAAMANTMHPQEFDELYFCGNRDIGPVGLCWNAHFRNPDQHARGLYLPNLDLARNIMRREIEQIEASAASAKSEYAKRLNAPFIKESAKRLQILTSVEQRDNLLYPTITETDLEVFFPPEQAPLAAYCKTPYTKMPPWKARIASA